MTPIQQGLLYRLRRNGQGDAADEIERLNAEVADWKDQSRIERTDKLWVMDRLKEERAAKEAAEAREARLRVALVKLLGERDDENIGWRGAFPSTSNHYRCEFCKAEHLDSTLTEHDAACPVVIARAALANTSEDIRIDFSGESYLPNASDGRER
jgi:hypothetical protein